MARTCSFDTNAELMFQLDAFTTVTAVPPTVAAPPTLNDKLQLVGVVCQCPGGDSQPVNGSVIATLPCMK